MNTKHFFITMMVLTALVLSGCRIGSQSVSSGRPDESYVCFFSPKKQDIQVNIDGETYSMQTIKDKEWRNDRNIKKTVKERITVAPGKHDITVFKGNELVLKKTIFISTNEYKIINL